MAEVIDMATLKALSTETRQEILKLLKNRPYTASELSKLLNKHVTTIAEHLETLESSGIIKKKDSTNKWVYYTLSDKGEKLFKPYYSWILLFSLGIIVFAVGIAELAFVSYQASTFRIAETAQSSAGTAGVAQTAAVETSGLNIIIGIFLLVAAVAFLWLSMRKRNRKLAITYAMDYQNK
jgi:DNA-binding transcriptional ArsR family regulator